MPPPGRWRPRAGGPPPPAACLCAAPGGGGRGGGRPPPADRWLAPWLWIGAAVALGLLSKLTMLAAPVCLGVFFAVRRQVRPAWGVAAGAALAGVLLAPWLAWNGTHGWAPFAWELAHGVEPQAGNPLVRLAEFAGGQLGVVGPIWLGAAAWFWWRTLRGKGEGAGLLWAALSAPVFAGFAAASLSAPAAANWPAMAYPAAACGLALVASRRLLALAGGTSAALAIAGLVHLIHPLGAVPPEVDPLRDTAGYRELALTAETAADDVGEGARILASRYQDAAALAFQLEDPRRVADVAGRGRPNQWDVWPPLPPGEPVVFVALNEARDAGCDPIGVHQVRYRGVVVRRYTLYPCRPPTDGEAWDRPKTLF